MSAKIMPLAGAFPVIHNGGPPKWRVGILNIDPTDPLTPEKARKLAAHLNAAADEAERQRKKGADS